MLYITENYMKFIMPWFSSKKWFTLLELMVSMTVFLILITAVTAIFINLYKIKWWLEARQRVTQETYFLIEKLQMMTKDYTIDYEEYWNRKNVWCGTAWNSAWNTGGNCTVMTYYGNRHKTKNTTNTNELTKHKLFYCSSENSEIVDRYIVWDGTSTDSIKTYIDTCLLDVKFPGGGAEFYQSYGQYAALFTDVKDDVDYVIWAAGDDDDVDKGNNVDAIFLSTTGAVQEIYLISHDKQRRILIRRDYKQKIDINNDEQFSPSEILMSLEFLQLRWFDAGENHDFDAENFLGVYDGLIDTWACDYSAGFECGGQSIGWAYSNYRLPISGDDGWKQLLWTDITISDWKIEIWPLKDPLLAWNDSNNLQSPYIRLSMTTQLYAENWQRKLTLDQMNNYILPIQTMFSFVN